MKCGAQTKVGGGGGNSIDTSERERGVTGTRAKRDLNNSVHAAYEG